MRAAGLNALLGVSIHTPTKGVTRESTFGLIPKWASFNPHTHEGCDIPSGIPIQQTGVSIHTPTKGVTVRR